jgi:hypothetical protein
MFIFVLHRVLFCSHINLYFEYMFPLSMVVYGVGNIFYHIMGITTRGQQQIGRPKI